jgi:signal transduction histidine kinase/ligand-binding sensor domain-containing protein
MRKKFIFFLGIFYILASIHHSLSAQNEIGKPFISNYYAKDYKGHSQNWSITQDDRGFIFIGNGDGVLIYDGTSWELIKLPKQVTARTLAKAPDGTIYVGSINELGYLRSNNIGQFEYISMTSLVEMEEFGTVWDIHFINNSIFFRTNEYLIRYNNHEFKYWKSKKFFNISFIFKNTFYIQDQGHGLFKLTKNELEIATGGKTFNGLAFNFGVELENEVALGSAKDGFFLYNGKRLRQIYCDASDYFKDFLVYHAVAYENDKVIAATNNGGCIIIDTKGEILRKINTQSGIQTNNVHHVFIDNQKNLWLGLNKGISKCEIATPISYWNQSNGLEGIVINIIRFNDTIYIATHQGIYYIENNLIKRLDKSQSQSWYFLDYKVPNSIKHKLLVATKDGIYEIHNKKLLKITSERTSLFMNQSKTDSSIIYVGFSENVGFLKYENNKFRFIGEIPNSGISIRSIKEDKNGNIWAGTFRHGITKIVPSKKILEPSAIKKYTLEDGFPSLKNILIYTFKNELVFATSNGLYKYDSINDNFFSDTTFKNIFKDEHKDIYAFYEDKDCDVWISQLYNKNGSIGIAKQNKDKAYTWINSELNRIPEMMVLALYVEDNKSTWIGGSEGLFKKEYTSSVQNKNITNTFIREVKLNTDSIIFGGNFYLDSLNNRFITNTQNENQIYEIRYKFNSLSFKYTSPTYYNETESLYQYFLDGYDENWSDWTNNSKKEYTNLSDGDYTFKVRSKNIYGDISEVTSYEFSISPPLYRTTVAYIMYFLSLLFIIWTSIKLYTKKLNAEKENLEKTVQEKTKNLHEINTLLEENQAELEIKQEEITAQAEHLTEINVELEEHKENLELLVQERTADLEVAKEKAEQSDKLKSAFLANMSHEIRTPMNAIIGFSHLLNDPDIGDENKSEIVSHITHNSDTLLNLIDDIIDISKIEAGQLEISKRESKINSILNELLNTFLEKKKHLNKENLEIKLNSGNDDSNFSILSDPLRIQQVITNLMDNALKFTNDGFVEFGYNVETDIENPSIIFYVKDTGIGLSEIDQKKIFNRFTKLEDDRRKLYRGAGLGLAICKNIAELLDGEIWVTSKINLGSQFYFKIPFHKFSETNTDNNKSETSIKTYSWPNKSILVAEDEESNFRYIEMLLSQTNVNLLHAKNGNEAIDLFLNNKLDLILMDIKMPELDGLEAVKEIRKTDTNIPIIAQTAFAMENDEIQSIEAGCSNYISKPIRKEKLLQLMKRYLE